MPPDSFGIAVMAADGQLFTAGDVEHTFAVQPLSTPVVAAMLMQQQGGSALGETIGVEATGFPSTSPEAMVLQAIRPSNPTVNAGAIAAVSLLRPLPAQTVAQMLPIGLSAIAGRLWRCLTIYAIACGETAGRLEGLEAARAHLLDGALAGHVGRGSQGHAAA